MQKCKPLELMVERGHAMTLATGSDELWYRQTASKHCHCLSGCAACIMICVVRASAPCSTGWLMPLLTFADWMALSR